MKEFSTTTPLDKDLNLRVGQSVVVEGSLFKGIKRINVISRFTSPFIFPLPPALDKDFNQKHILSKRCFSFRPPFSFHREGGFDCRFLLRVTVELPAEVPNFGISPWSVSIAVKTTHSRFHVNHSW